MLFFKQRNKVISSFNFDQNHICLHKKSIISALMIDYLDLLSLIPNIMIKKQIQSKYVVGETGLLLAPIENLLANSDKKLLNGLLIKLMGIWWITFNLLVNCKTWMYYANKLLIAAGQYYVLSQVLQFNKIQQKNKIINSFFYNHLFF